MPLVLVRPRHHPKPALLGVQSCRGVRIWIVNTRPLFQPPTTTLETNSAAVKQTVYLIVNGPCLGHMKSDQNILYYVSTKVMNLHETYVLGSLKNALGRFTSPKTVAYVLFVLHNSLVPIKTMNHIIAG